jgi:hypothetical protein
LGYIFFILFEKKVYNQNNKRNKNPERRYIVIIRLFILGIWLNTLPYEYKMNINKDHLKVLTALRCPDKHNVTALNPYRINSVSRTELNIRSGLEYIVSLYVSMPKLDN